ncbi:Hypothetical_protein [Hexamita inflata]|uniref:Hypothetical_protein n=1 Tax=Hexamita inflata TaxID=28002 RepID=A0AA86TZ11_9EUKA|nr:Hypothetical protein HINF_LOCUS21421 [Hexamita inflata]
MIDKDDFDRCRVLLGKTGVQEKCQWRSEQEEINFAQEELPRVPIFSHLIVIFLSSFFFFLQPGGVEAGGYGNGSTQDSFKTWECDSRQPNRQARLGRRITRSLAAHSHSQA